MTGPAAAGRALRVALPSTDGLLERLTDVTDVEFVTWDLDTPPAHPHYDIVVPPNLAGPEVLGRLAGIDVALVQWQSIGTDGVAEHLPAHLPFANATTVHEGATAELALALTLAAQRGLPGFVREGLAGAQEARLTPGLIGTRIVIIGYGGVARALDALLRPFDAVISRFARSARSDADAAGRAVTVHAMGELPTHLAEADIVILTVPLTPDTRALVDREFLSALRDGALLVNVARGPVVVTEDLVVELRTGRLRAALDVTDPEPLPADHELWSLPGALVTPHVGADTHSMPSRMAALLRRQIEHLRRGERPENLISFTR